MLLLICRTYTVLPWNHFCWLSLNSFHVSAIELVRTEFINSSRYISLQFSSLNLILLPAHISELFRSLFIISPCSLTLATPVSLQYDCTIRKQGSCRAKPQGNSKQYWVLTFGNLPRQRGNIRNRCLKQCACRCRAHNAALEQQSLLPSFYLSVVLPGHEGSKGSSWPRESIFQALAYAHHRAVPLHPPTDSSVRKYETVAWSHNSGKTEFFSCTVDIKTYIWGCLRLKKMEQPVSLY